MKEFIEKLIAKMEEIPTKNKCSECPHKQKCDEIEAMDKDEQVDLCGATIKSLAIDAVKEIAEEYRNDKVCQTAIMYAKNLHKYGVQIDSIWETATQQSMALNQAYMRGRQDERDIFDEWQEKHINTSTDTSSDISTDTSSGWIPCSRELPPQPKENPLFEYKPLEVYLVSLSSTDYPWRAFWNGKYFTDGFSKVEPIAWQPLPAPFKKGE